MSADDFHISKCIGEINWKKFIVHKQALCANKYNVGTIPVYNYSIDVEISVTFYNTVLTAPLVEYSEYGLLNLHRDVRS